MTKNSKLLKVLVVLALFGSQNIALAQQFNQKFDTKNHPKAKGVWAQVSYPDGWVAKEGQRPNIVQLITGKQDGVDVQLHLQIRDVGEDIEKECANTSETEWNEAFTNKDANMAGTNSKKIKIEGKPAFITDLTAIHQQRVDLKLVMASKQMAVCHKKTMVILWCANFIAGENIQLAKSNLAKVDNICQLYFNSFVLMDKS